MAGVGFFRIGIDAIGAVGNIPLGYQKVTDLSTSTSLDVPIDADLAIIVPEYSPVRYRDDGVEPTPTEGMPASINVPLQYFGNLVALRFIELSPGAAINVLYYQCTTSIEEVA